MTYYSNCCGAEIRYPNSDITLCPHCKEYCDYEVGEDDEEFFERKLVKTNLLQKIFIITIVSIVFIVLLIGVYVNNK